MKVIPTGFIPQEDGGAAMGMITLPPGASLERTDSVVRQVVQIVQEIPDVKVVSSISGVNFMIGVGSSYGSVIIKMQPWSDRKVTVNEVVARLTQETSHIQDATFLFFPVPTIQGFGLASGVSLELEDRTGGDIDKFSRLRMNFWEGLTSRNRSWQLLPPLILISPKNKLK